MSRQYFGEVLQPLMTADQAATFTSVAELALWPVAPWTALAANQLQPGQAWRVTAGGVMSTAAAPGTMIITPRYGTTTGGVALGASIASPTLIASLTNIPWQLQATFVARSAGTAATGILTGFFTSQAVGPAPAGELVFGGTVATIDTTAASGLWIAATATVATNTLTTRYLTFEALN